jgi:cleavage stimulation factor subunit 2
VLSLCSGTTCQAKPEHAHTIVKTLGCGKLTTHSCRLVKTETGQLKGFGFCEYRDVETAESAIRNLDNHELHGRPLRIDHASNIQDKGEGGRGGGGRDRGRDRDKSDDRHAKKPNLRELEDQVSNVVHRMSFDQMYEVVGQLKTIVAQNREQGKELLLQFPQLSSAFLAMQDRLKNERNMAPPGGGGHRPPLQADPRMETPRDMRMDHRNDPRGGMDPRLDQRAEARDDMRDSMDPRMPDSRMAGARVDPRDRDRPPYQQGPPRGEMRGAYSSGAPGMHIDSRTGPPPSGMPIPPPMHERPPTHMPAMARDDMLMRKEPIAAPGMGLTASASMMDRPPPANMMPPRPAPSQPLQQQPPVAAHSHTSMQGLMNLASMHQVRYVTMCCPCVNVCMHLSVLALSTLQWLL